MWKLQKECWIFSGIFYFFYWWLMKKILVVLAAGMWSRFWWVKQVARVGKEGETILDFSIRDAILAWFTDVVYVIRKEIEQDVRDIVSDKYEDQIITHYAYQESPEWRSKPLGTGHALLVAKEFIDSPCLVINADDYYGFQSMMLAAAWLDNCAHGHFAMVWFKLANTLSDFGSVNRWICTVQNGHLVSVLENLGIYRDISTWVIKTNVWRRLEPNDVVSMNFRMFHPSALLMLQQEFDLRYEQHNQNPTVEFFLPSYCNSLIQGLRGSCDVLVSPDTRIGITNREDFEEAKRIFSKR